MYSHCLTDSADMQYLAAIEAQCSKLEINCKNLTADKTGSFIDLVIYQNLNKAFQFRPYTEV